MLGSAPGDSTGTQQDPTSTAQAALLILVNLSQFILGCVATPAHQTLPYFAHLTFQGGPGGGMTAPGSHGLSPAAASSRPRSCNSANKGVSAPSAPARKGPGPHVGSPVLVTNPTDSPAGPGRNRSLSAPAAARGKALQRDGDGEAPSLPGSWQPQPRRDTAEDRIKPFVV